MILSRRLATLSCVALLLFGTASPAFGEGRDRDDVKAQIQERKEENQNKREEQRQAIIQKRADKLEKHCAKLSDVLTTFSNRINERVAAQNTRGWDTSSAANHLALAKTSLESANALCAQAVDKYNSIPADQWNTQKTMIVEARALAKQAHDTFVETRKHLVEAIRALSQTWTDHQGEKEDEGTTPSPSPSPAPSPSPSPSATPSSE